MKIMSLIVGLALIFAACVVMGLLILGLIAMSGLFINEGLMKANPGYVSYPLVFILSTPLILITAYLVGSGFLDSRNSRQSRATSDRKGKISNLARSP